MSIAGDIYDFSQMTLGTQPANSTVYGALNGINTWLVVAGGIDAVLNQSLRVTISPVATPPSCSLLVFVPSDTPNSTTYSEMIALFKSSPIVGSPSIGVAVGSQFHAAENVTAGGGSVVKSIGEGSSTLLGVCLEKYFNDGEQRHFLDSYSQIAATMVDDAWYFMRTRVDGTLIKTKLWAYEDTEPTGWGVEANYSIATNDLPGMFLALIGWGVLDVVYAAVGYGTTPTMPSVGDPTLTGDAAIDIPDYLLEAGSGSTGNVDVDITVDAYSGLTGDVTFPDYVLGSTGAGNAGWGQIVFPDFDISSPLITADGEIEYLDVHGECSVVGYTGSRGAVEAKFDFEGNGWQKTSGDGEVDFAEVDIEVEGYTGARGSVTLPGAIVTGEASGSIVCHGQVTFPKASVVASALTGIAASSALDFAPFTLSGSDRGLGDIVGTGSIQFALFRLLGTAPLPSDGDGIVRFADFVISSSGYIVSQGAGVIVFPEFEMEAFATNGLSCADELIEFER